MSNGFQTKNEGLEFQYFRFVDHPAVAILGLDFRRRLMVGARSSFRNVRIGLNRRLARRGHGQSASSWAKWCLNDIAMPLRPQPPLRCFVAMAFDQPDTDAVFTAIDTTLKPMRIKAIRVDRVEHNDDIDDRIISEIKDADFAIADLTYARPSVYFEAGFAHRSIPVIYTVRSDHFKPKANDPNGNLRVHFDLQMKNIISWKEPNDIFFQKRLRSRLSKVIAPLLRQKALTQDAKAKVARFTGKSLQEQRE